jgi:hypothetical protein
MGSQDLMILLQTLAFAEGDQTPLFAVSLRGAGYGNRVVEVVGSKWWIAWKE